MRRMLIGLIVLLWAVPAGATTWNAANCTQSEVLNKIASAANGDTVTIPACPSGQSWTSGLTISKAITLQGAGVGQTVILDDASDATDWWTITLVAGQTTRITGIEFKYGTRTTRRWNYAMKVEGLNTDARRFRMDYCKYEQLYSGIFLLNTVLGVIDHNTFNIRNDITAGLGYVKGYSWDGYTYGDGSWAAADQFGSDQFIFFEDNTIRYSGETHVTLLDAQAGGRYVARYNHVYQGNFEGHGTESGGRERGTRAVEIYRNDFHGINTQNSIVYLRGGVGLVHHNTVEDYDVMPVITIISNRSITAFTPWGGADGQNAWDVNLAGGPFTSGTVSAIGTRTITKSGAGWSSNQWVGYSLHRTSNVGGVTGQDFSEISSNTTDTITYRASIGYPPPNGDLAFTVGDTFEVYKVTHAMDQIGRSGGSRVSGETPSPPSGWNNQTTSPWYEWANTGEGGLDIGFNAAWGPIRAGEHYISNTAKPGYTEYTYPHPLASGAVPAPSAPTNVRIR